MGAPRRGTPMVLVVAPLVLAAGLLAGCGPAHGTVKVEDRFRPGSGPVAHLVFTAAPGRANDVTVTPSGSELLVHDGGDTITPGSGCTAEDANTVRCLGVSVVTMNLGDGNDVASNNTSVRSGIWTDQPGIQGGPGDDVLNGGTAKDDLIGDQGTDTLIGNEGDDNLIEGWTAASTDELDVDTIDGGPGKDAASYLQATQRLSLDLDGQADDGLLTGEGDTVQSDVESLIGGAAQDFLSGDANDNVLAGQGGNDSLVGFEGNDVLVGGSGDDTLREGSLANNVDALDADTFFGDGCCVEGGVDTVAYGAATASLRVDLDNVADDGRQAPLEGDNVRSDVENVTGGGGNDSLFGDVDANQLIGNAGADVLSGDAGGDVLRGNTGFDPLNGGEGEDDCNAGPAGPDGGTEVNCEI